MVKRILGSQAFMSIAGALVIVLLAVVGYVIAFDPIKETRSYCAIMPDSVGLYEGNKVSMRGIDVGTVTGIRPEGAAVRVDFEVDGQYPVYADASATTVSDSVVADRELAVLASGKTAEQWDAGQCITKTLTPKSLTETITALAALSEEIGGTPQTQPDALAGGLRALDSATAGTGAQINNLVMKLGSTLKSPDADIGHLAGIFDAFSSVSQKVSTHWGDLKTMLTRLAPVLNQASNDLLVPGAALFDGLREVLPMLNDLTTILADPLMGTLDGLLPLVKMLRANVGSLRDIVLMTPALTSAFRSVTDPSTGAPGLVYAPPKVAIAQRDADQVCTAINAVAPGRCAGAGNGMVDVQLVQLVLGLAGAR
ncbi:MlaD family protein [Nocardia cyriacigeorgica]|uniref:MlaD family protein n=1 Tax=Nocardia cyriacigeorgica TaxID=135487 RepID=UPI0003007B10|nr:MlaD family protein [Nocardia cyriacigeorgica]MBF6325956.1 MCE family protein [Nocardia cyriacigeorgica]MBF6499480.1 MCE family protein [Nocardia cyriacigeorgica]TLF54710.1 MCE family protein [Nocardia cyriacigeorgica]